MAAVKDASEMLPLLLDGGPSTIAGRMAGAFRHAGQEQIAYEIVKTTEKAGYAVRETNPFADAPRAVLPARERSPVVNRMRLMWQAMRGPVLGLLPASPGPPRSPRADPSIARPLRRDVSPKRPPESALPDQALASPKLEERRRDGGPSRQRTSYGRHVSTLL